MRTALLVMAGLALLGFLTVAIVLPRMAEAEAREAAEALLAGAEAAKRQVSAAAEKSRSLAGAGRGIRLATSQHPRHGELKWVIAEDGAIRGWNESNALEVALTPRLEAQKVAWSCRGYPLGAMPQGCR
jgi:hypothetical protein